MLVSFVLPFFFFNDTATTEIYTLSLHDALPILKRQHIFLGRLVAGQVSVLFIEIDRKSTRLNSSHITISYSVFCLKKKNIMHGTEQHESKPSQRKEVRATDVST